MQDSTQDSNKTPFEQMPKFEPPNTGEEVPRRTYDRAIGETSDVDSSGVDHHTSDVPNVERATVHPIHSPDAGTETSGGRSIVEADPTSSAPAQES